MQICHNAIIIAMITIVSQLVMYPTSVSYVSYSNFNFLIKICAIAIAIQYSYRLPQQTIQIVGYLFELTSSARVRLSCSMTCMQCHGQYKMYSYRRQLASQLAKYIINSMWLHIAICTKCSQLSYQLVFYFVYSYELLKFQCL